MTSSTWMVERRWDANSFLNTCLREHCWMRAVTRARTGVMEQVSDTGKVVATSYGLST